MAKLWGRDYTRAELLRRVGDISQIASAQAVELADGNQRGVRSVNLRNAAGLDLSVLTERGMAITDLRYQGIPVPFVSPVGSVHPAFSDLHGTDWLRTWPGGFLTPCGLTQVGSPVQDGTEELGLHGWLAGIPARNVAWGGEWQGDDYRVWVQGVMREVAMFGWNLELTRRVWTGLTGSSFWVEDRVENLGFSPAPLMILQHINLGFPLVDATTRLELPAHTNTVPRTEVARGGLEHCLEFQDPTPGYSEQVFYHYLQADALGQVEVRLVNPAFNGGQGLGVSLRYALADFPVLTEWKMMGEGLYAVGVEPGNCRVEGRVLERERGTLQVLEPGEARTFRLQITFFQPG